MNLRIDVLASHIGHLQLRILELEEENRVMGDTVQSLQGMLDKVEREGDANDV